MYEEKIAQCKEGKSSTRRSSIRAHSKGCLATQMDGIPNDAAIVLRGTGAQDV